MPHDAQFRPVDEIFVPVSRRFHVGPEEMRYYLGGKGILAWIQRKRSAPLQVLPNGLNVFRLVTVSMEYLNGAKRNITRV